MFDPLTGMIVGGLVSGIGGLLGAGQQANAAERSAELTAEATRDAAEMQQQQYQQTRTDLQPWQQAGANAVGQLGQMVGSGQLSSQYDPMGGMKYTQGLPQFQKFGIDPMQQYQRATQPINVNLAQDPGYQARLQAGTEAIEGSATARGGLFSGQTGKALAEYGQELGAQEYQNAYNRTMQERQMQNQAYGQAFGQHLAQQGQSFGQDMTGRQFGAQQYGTGTQTDLAQKQSDYNMLAGLSGQGQQAAGMGGQFGAQTAQGIGQLGLGQAQAQGQAGQQAAGAWGGAMQNIGNQLTGGLGSYMNYQMLQGLL